MIGVVSATFKSFSPTEIVEIVASSQVDSIEWSSLHHIFPGDYTTARRVCTLCQQNKVNIASYGSYYRLCTSQYPMLEFETYLKTAECLQTKNIRIWAGDRSPHQADEEYWEQATTELQDLAALAEEKGMQLSLEYHAKTLTETAESVRLLLEDSPNVRTYWQVDRNLTHEENLIQLEQLTDKISNIHVFWQHPDPPYHRTLLKHGVACWKDYLHLLYKRRTKPEFLIEFVEKDSTISFTEDVKSLRLLLIQSGFIQ